MPTDPNTPENQDIPYPLNYGKAVLSNHVKGIAKNKVNMNPLVALSKIYKICKKAESNFLMVLIIFIKNKLVHHKNIIMHPRVIIKGYKNIMTDNVLQIGLGNAKFVHKYDVTFLNIFGSLYFKGNYTIGRGCRFDIGENAIVIIGRNGRINANTTLIIMHKLTIGDDCSISWNCQILDEDFHNICYSGKVNASNEIMIGNNVWVGCDVKIYKGTIIPDGSVIAAGSSVRGIFTEANTLIGGNPAKIIKKMISWK